MEKKDLEIITGKEVKEKVSKKGIETLADQWHQHLLQDEILKTREDLKDGLSRPFSELIQDEDFLKKVSSEEKEYIAEKTAKQELDIVRAYKNEDMVIAKQNGKIVGMAKIAKIPNTEIYELGKLFVASDARGQRISRQLIEQALKLLKEKYGDQTVILCTQNPRVKVSLNSAWDEIGFAEYLRMRGHNISNEDVAEDVKEGWTGFLLKPKT